MRVKAPDYRKNMLVKAKLQFEGFDNATQPQKPHWESVQPVFAFPYEYKIHGRNIREWNNFPWYSSFQRREIHKRIYPRHQNSLQAKGKPFDIPILLRATLQGVKRGFIKGEAIRLLRTNSSKQHLKSALQTLNDASKHGGIQRNI